MEYKKKIDFLIVGAGFYGSVLAERISSILKKKVIINIDDNHNDGDAHDKVNNIKIVVENNKIINLDEYIIPKTYNYRQNYNITELGKKICNETQINHIEIRKKILEYLKDNKKLDLNDNEIENIKFKLSNIDKFIGAYILHT